MKRIGFLMLLLIVSCNAHIFPQNKPQTPDKEYISSHFVISNIREVIDLKASELTVDDEKGNFSSYAQGCAIANVIIDLYKNDKYYFSAVGKNGIMTNEMKELLSQANEGDSLIFNSVKIKDQRGDTYPIRDLSIVK